MPVHRSTARRRLASAFVAEACRMNLHPERTPLLNNAQREQYLDGAVTLLLAESEPAASAYEDGPWNLARLRA